MQLQNAFGILDQVRMAFQVAAWPTLVAIVKDPSLLLQPIAIRRIFMAHVWTLFGNGMDEGLRPLKNGLITPNAYGTVLDIGAGHGHTAKYLDRIKVTKYVALEPNESMHTHIRQNASTAGFTEAEGTLIIIPYGAEHITLIHSALGGAHAVDTLVSFMSLCSIPPSAISPLVGEVLKPGGTLLFYEHVRNPRRDVAWWQDFWAPMWKWVMDGCTIGAPTDKVLVEMDVWKEKNVWTPEDEPEEHLFWHQVGKLLKQ